MINKTRNVQIDILRGIGIILIVLGHSGFPCTHFLYLFHLAIFFIASGYFFKEDYVKDKQTFKKFIINKIKRLYLPFVIGNIICVLLNNFFININLYNSINHNYLTIKETAIGILKVVLFKGHTEMLGATWFLPILFIITIGYGIVEYIAKKYSRKNIIQFIVSVVLFLLGYYLSVKNIDIKFISLQVLTCYILFDFGRKISKYKDETKDKTKILIMVTSFILLIILNNLGTIELSRNEYTNPIYFICVSLLGWCFIYEISYFLSKIKIITKSLQYIGQNTMPIVILHFIAFKIVNIIFVLIFNADITSISQFPVWLKGGAWWIIYTLAGILIPIAFNEAKKYLVKFMQSRIKKEQNL